MRAVAATLLAVPLLAACGASAHPARSARAQGSADASADVSPSGSPSAPASAQATGAAPHTSARSSAPATAVKLTVALGSGCVVPGGTQSITLHTGPSWSATWDTTYADGHHGDWYGGRGIAVAGADGVVRQSWRVAANAPTGSARVDVGSQPPPPHPSTPLTASASFTVAQHCPAT